METAVTSVVCIALIVMGGMTMSQNFVTSLDTSASGLEQISQRDVEIARTDVNPIAASATSSRINVTLKNTGETKLADFSHWDTIVEYRHGSDQYVTWLPYVSGTPSGDQWTVTGIYINAQAQTPEVIEPGVLNPGEEMVIRISVSHSISSGSNGRVVMCTPNGVPAVTIYDR